VKHLFLLQFIIHVSRFDYVVFFFFKICKDYCGRCGGVCVLFPTPTSTSRFLTSKSRSPGAARITTGQRFGDGGGFKKKKKNEAKCEI
jgi:hypothetical protein